jgi:palmitoyl-protein thioesterase
MAASRLRLQRLPLVIVAAFVVALCVASASAAASAAHTLPIIFFHGVTSNAKAGTNLRMNLETPTRPFVALNFCEDTCSVRDLPTQVNLAIAQIRSTVANDSRFDDGYVVIAHSQGGILARAVLEEMDDHKAHTFISLAGAQNGNFYGPQPTDAVPTQVFLQRLGPKVLPKELFNFANYTAEQVANGALQIDFLKLVNAQPELQQKLSMANLLRSPVQTDWERVNKFMPTVNNMGPEVDEDDAARRKENFLRLEAAHFFASPADDVISPWQTSILGKYKDVSSMEQLAKKFTTLTVVPMTKTHEYSADTYGLKTLDKRGGLFLHTVDGVGHSCWVADSTPTGATQVCKFQPIFDEHLAPLIGATKAAASDSPRQSLPFQYEPSPVRSQSWEDSEE